MVQKKDWLIIAIVLVIIAALVAAVVLTQRGTRDATDQPTDADAAGPRAYLRITTSDMVYDPIPLEDNNEYKITQKNGTLENVVRVTADSVQMHTSNCDNQDCVEQGAITLENRDTRLLYNMIICLPNQVMLELLTPEEAEAAMP